MEAHSESFVCRPERRSNVQGWAAVIFMPPQPWIEVICNDRLGRKVRVKCLEEDLMAEFKSVLALQIGIAADRIVLKKGYITFKDHISLADYEIHDQSMLELYYS